MSRPVLDYPILFKAMIPRPYLVLRDSMSQAALDSHFEDEGGFSALLAMGKTLSVQCHQHNTD